MLTSTYNTVIVPFDTLVMYSFTWQRTVTVKHANDGSVSESKIHHISIILRNKETAKAVHDVAVFTERRSI